MSFGPTQVSAQDRLRHEIGFGSERFQFELSFEPRRVLAHGGFWIGTGRFGSGSGRHGFPHRTGFGSQRVLGRHENPHGTGFRPTHVSGRTSFVPFRRVPFRPVPFRIEPFRREPFRRVPFRRELFRREPFQPVPKPSILEAIHNFGHFGKKINKLLILRCSLPSGFSFTSYVVVIVRSKTHNTFHGMLLSSAS
ncbi:hypothetical protein Hanom_Chr03g00260931 [Helianthus anomalus]